MEIILQIAGALVLLVVVSSAYIIVEAWYYQMRLGPTLESELGFHEGTEYIRVGRRLYSAVSIKTIVEDGVFAKSGLTAGDVFPGLSHTGLFKRLHTSRGKFAELTVVDGGEGPPFSHRSKRIIKVAVPSSLETT